MIKKSLSDAFESEILKFLPFYNLSIVKEQIDLVFVFSIIHHYLKIKLFQKMDWVWLLQKKRDVLKP